MNQSGYGFFSRIVGRREVQQRVEPERLRLNPWAHGGQRGGLEGRRVYEALVQQILDRVEHCLALATVALGRRLLEQLVDVGMAAVGVGDAADDEGLQPSGCVARPR